MLIYFLRGTLPWRKIRATPEAMIPTDATPSETADLIKHYNPVTATWDLIRDAKMANEELLTLGLPPEFDVLYRYARNLEFDDLPDYEGLRSLFRGLAERVGVVYDGVFDWTTSESASATGKGKGKGAEGHGHGRRSMSEGTGAVVGGGTGGRRYCEACNARNRR